MEEKALNRLLTSNRNYTDRKFEKIERMLENVKQTKITLVKSGFIKELTGLDKEGMRRARENNLITQVKNQSGIFYELETIHQVILKPEKRGLVFERG